MLLLSDKLKNVPVMSLQTGAEIAKTEMPVIDPGILEVVAYRLVGRRLGKESLLVMTSDIREFSNIGIIIDSSDELILETDVVKVQNLISLGFGLIDMNVIDDQKNKLGKVYDYSLDPLTFTIHQLYVKRPLLKSLQTSQLIISRTQIAEINNKSIVVHSASLKQRPQPAAVDSHFVNPFRSPQPRPEPNAPNRRVISLS